MKKDIRWKIKSVQNEDLLDSWSGRVIELVRSINFYEFFVLRRGSKEELLVTIVLKVWKVCGSFGTWKVQLNEVNHV